MIGNVELQKRVRGIVRLEGYEVNDIDRVVVSDDDEMFVVNMQSDLFNLPKLVDMSNKIQSLLEDEGYTVQTVNVSSGVGMTVELIFELEL